MEKRDQKIGVYEIEDLFDNEDERIRVLSLPKLEREQEITRLKELVMHIEDAPADPVHSDDSLSSGEIRSRKHARGADSDDEYLPKKLRPGIIRPDLVLQKPKGEVKLEHVESIRVGRDQLVAWINQREFDKTVEGTFVRVNLGTKTGTNEPVYMMCEVEGIQEQGEAYEFGGKKKARTRKVLVLRHGKSKKSMKLEFVSNTPFSTKEFEEYERKMLTDSIKPISHDHVERKRLDIDKATNYHYTSEEIDEINERNLEQEMREGRVGASSAMILEKWQVKQMEAERCYRETNDSTYLQTYQFYDTKIKQLQNFLKADEEETQEQAVQAADPRTTQENTPEEEES